MAEPFGASQDTLLACDDARDRQKCAELERASCGKAQYNCRKMTDVAAQFISESRRFLSSDYLPKIERCLEALSEDDVWWRPDEHSNSIGNLLLHLNGSTRAWIVGVVGGSESPRDRQREFDERERIPRSELMSRLRQTVAEADAVLARLDPAALPERRQARTEEVTVLLAIYHAVEHFSMHTGQIIMLTKMRSEGFA
jgi:uncharacterized damage-inducible protein DinB